MSSGVARTIIEQNGVKQGSVLLLRLFAVCMDAFVLRLQEAGYGCHIGDKYIGALIYVENFLRLMLNIVNNFGKEFGVKFNCNKSQYIVFGTVKSIPIAVKFNYTLPLCYHWQKTAQRLKVSF